MLLNTVLVWVAEPENEIILTKNDIRILFSKIVLRQRYKTGQGQLVPEATRTQDIS